jgi:MFS family permease
MIDPVDKRAHRATSGNAVNASFLHAPSSMLHARSRWGIYLLLIAIAVGNMTGRLLSVNSVDKVQLETYRIREALDRKRAQLAEEGLTEQEIAARVSADEARIRSELRLQRPFLSANDRSRWMTVRSLVEHGTYEIDKIQLDPTWDTIDMVQHQGRDGKDHRYSSKPPLLATLLAGEYWLIHRITGLSLKDNPYEVGRFMLFTINILPLLLMYVIIGRLVERFGMTDWGRIFVMAAATLGTFLNTYATVLNNHIVGAVCATVALYAAVRIAYDGERRTRYFVLAGFAAALTAADELPALTFLGLIGVLLLWNAPWKTLAAFVPAMLVVVAAFFATNWIAHESLRPPYMHRGEGDNWYSYEYELKGRSIKSYWLDRQGIDRGEPSKLTYAVHVLVGHHGVFSLTPIWLLSIAGALMWLWSPDRSRRQLAAGALLIAIICLVFFIALRPLQDRNYGGMTSGFRWMFWCAPLWLVVMIPAADRLARSTAGMAFAALLLTFSVLSLSYPTWNPWTHPWIYNWMEWTGWKGF